jgi:hypothetical protein
VNKLRNRSVTFAGTLLAFVSTASGARGDDQLAVILNAPLERQVFQRKGEVGQIYIGGIVPGGADRVDAQVTNGAKVVVSWNSIALGADEFGSYVTVPAGGWFTVQIRAVRGKVSTVVTVDHVGIGEVFLTAGQSNSANSGLFRFAALDTVSAWNGTGWVVANDPQPIADGLGGSTWAVMGNTLTTELNLPIGLISVGVGKTAVRDWLPGAPPFLPRFDEPLFNRIAQVEQTFRPWGGFRALLWHQGESDSHQDTPTEVYCDDLTTIIQASRAQLGTGDPVPWWLIAHATSYNNPPQERLQVLHGQSCAIHRNPPAFPGPDTDAIVPPRDRQWDDIHFNKRGQERAGRAWAESIVAALREEGDLAPMMLGGAGQSRRAVALPTPMRSPRGGGSVPRFEPRRAAPSSMSASPQRSHGTPTRRRPRDASAQSPGAHPTRQRAPGATKDAPKQGALLGKKESRGNQRSGIGN